MDKGHASRREPLPPGMLATHFYLKYFFWFAMCSANVFA